MNKFDFWFASIAYAMMFFLSAIIVPVLPFIAPKLDFMFWGIELFCLFTNAVGGVSLFHQITIVRLRMKKPTQTETE